MAAQIRLLLGNVHFANVFICFLLYAVTFLLCVCGALRWLLAARLYHTTYQPAYRLLCSTGISVYTVLPTYCTRTTCCRGSSALILYTVICEIPIFFNEYFMALRAGTFGKLNIQPILQVHTLKNFLLINILRCIF